MAKMTLTSHNKKGVKSTHHQDRTNTDEATHIDHDKTKNNIYWQWDCGKTDTPDFEACELKFYKERYSKSVEEQNKRNDKNRHSERNKTIEQLYDNKRTSPTETYFQIGNKDNHADEKTLLNIMSKFQRKMNKYSKNFHILDIALHVDEKTPHIAYRSIIDYEKDGIITIGQDKGLETMGFDLPESKARGKNNNRRMSFDKYCRNLLIEICKEHDIDIECIGDGHKHLEKEEFIKKQELEKALKNIDIDAENKVNEYINITNQKIEKACKNIDKRAEDIVNEHIEKTNNKLDSRIKEITLKSKEKLKNLGLEGYDVIGTDFNR